MKPKNTDATKVSRAIFESGIQAALKKLKQTDDLLEAARVMDEYLDIIRKTHEALSKSAQTQPFPRRSKRGANSL